MKDLKIKYTPETSKQRFCQDTGNPLPRSTGHYLEIGEGKHLEVISDSVPDPAAIGHLFEAAPDLLTTLTWIRDNCTGLPAVARALADQAIRKAEPND